MKPNHDPLQHRSSFLSSIVLFLIMAFSLAMPQPTYAQGDTVGGVTWYVATTGNDSNSCTAAGSPCLTINGAIGKAAAGDTINIAIGIYTNPTTNGAGVVSILKDITLVGGWDETFTIQTGMSSIDGENVRGGIEIGEGNVTLDHLAIQNGSNGGIYIGSFGPSQSVLILNSSTVNNNSNDFGGGIEIYYGTVTINNSTVDNNIASSSGGGIYSYGGIVTINNSTISGNVAQVQGGGIYFSYLNTSLDINNSTIVNNSSPEGGGFYRYMNSGVVNFRNTILANNTATTGTDCVGIINYSLGYNLIGNNSSCMFSATTGDQVGTNSNPINPYLTPLQDNGGPTFTHALYANSPAVNHGNPATPGSGGNACLATDQRGITRPQGNTCDIGAFEGSIPAVIPIPKSPTSIITDITPTFKWTKLNGATKYQYQLVKGTTVIYNKTLPASACSASPCVSTPATALSYGNYKWRVRAMIGGVWKSYSPYKPFKLFPAKPGFWNNPGLEFYVIKTSPKVDNFAIYITVNGCGNYKIIHYPVAPISNKRFSFTGSFYANGTFITPTTAQGTLGLSSFYISGCGYLTGGPFSWTATWRNGNQPTLALNDGDIPEFTVSPESTTPFELFTIDPEK